MFRPARLFSSKNRRAPLQWTPRRANDQSVDDQIRALRCAWGDTLSLPLCLALLALYEWWRWLFSMTPNPLLLTVAAAIAIHATWRRRKLYRSELNQLRLASDAQPITNESLDLRRIASARLMRERRMPPAPAAMVAALRRFLSPANGLAKRLATVFMNNLG